MEERRAKPRAEDQRFQLWNGHARSTNDRVAVFNVQSFSSNEAATAAPLHRGTAQGQTEMALPTRFGARVAVSDRGRSEEVVKTSSL